MPQRLRVIALLPLLAMSGCMFFDRDYHRAAALPADPNNPLNGAWQGYWQSFASDAHGPVWLIFTMTDADHANMRLKTYGLGANVMLWDMDNITVHHPPTGLQTMSFHSGDADNPMATFNVAQRGGGLTVSFLYPDAVQFGGIMILHHVGPATQPFSATRMSTTEPSH